VKVNIGQTLPARAIKSKLISRLRYEKTAKKLNPGTGTPNKKNDEKTN
jgi:hypothetical protein